MSRVMFLAERESVPETIVIGVEPDRIEWGTDLSPKIQDKVPMVIEAVKMEIDRHIS